MTEIAARKAALRAAMLARRAAFDPNAGEALAAIALRELTLPPGAAIAGVWPLQGELDLRPLLHALHARGHPILLPQTPRRGNPLIFRRWAPGTAMIAERFGTQRPDGPEGVPDVILVPLLAFDARGNRLGYGGGYYDCTLAALPDREAIGFAHAGQQVDEVPTEPHDQPLHRILTDTALLHANKNHAM
jgi:5-formyltetrahydrofolate cyclo-ligase